MESEECGIFFNVPKIGNLYYINIDQLQYVNNHISLALPDNRNFVLSRHVPGVVLKSLKINGVGARTICLLY